MCVVFLGGFFVFFFFLSFFLSFLCFCCVFVNVVKWLQILQTSIVYVVWKQVFNYFQLFSMSASQYTIETAIITISGKSKHSLMEKV